MQSITVMRVRNRFHRDIANKSGKLSTIINATSIEEKILRKLVMRLSNQLLQQQ